MYSTTALHLQEHAGVQLNLCTHVTLHKLKILSKPSPSRATGFFQSTVPQKYTQRIKLLLLFAPSPTPLGFKIIQQILSLGGAELISTG